MYSSLEIEMSKGKKKRNRIQDGLVIWLLFSFLSQLNEQIYGRRNSVRFQELNANLDLKKSGMLSLVM
jgi:hypothetical protein